MKPEQMEGLGYFHFKRSEIRDILLIGFGLGLLFTFTFFAFQETTASPLSVFFVFSGVLLAVLFSRMAVMKLVAIANAADFSLYMTRFDRFGLRPYDRISHFTEGVEKPVKKAKPGFMDRWFSDVFVEERQKRTGIPMIFISYVLYFLTLGLFIFPSIWRYQVATIDRLFLGTQKFPFETGIRIFYNTTISGYRISQVLFTGFVFYVIVLILLKYLLYPLFGDWFWWIFYMITWIALVTVIPIPGTEGCDLWFCNRYAWIMALTIVVLGPASIIIFTNPVYVVLSLFIIFLMVTSVYLWKKFMG